MFKNIQREREREIKKIKPNAQQRFQEMARNVVNSRFSFARNIFLVENMRLRSSPLLEAAKRQAVKKLNFSVFF
ncbi:vacuolar-type H+-ATPase subunit E/Vma4 [Chryseobacterium sp. MP_3.2]|nr:vacuolar-type H+-ATPase subunit E/Vma4 [Chryseobacterium sp. MP_3.2]